VLFGALWHNRRGKDLEAFAIGTTGPKKVGLQILAKREVQWYKHTMVKIGAENWAVDIWRLIASGDVAPAALRT
jgi:hypothetical protein